MTDDTAEQTNDREDGGPVDGLLPDELNIENNEDVVPLDGGRYVIGTGDGPVRPPEPGTEPAVDDGVSTAQTGEGLDQSFGEESVVSRVRDSPDHFAFSVVAKFGDTIARYDAAVPDAVSLFSELLTWYAAQIGPETPSAEVVGLLLAASDLELVYPKAALKPVLTAHGLTVEDSIGDFLAALDTDGGLRL